MDVLNLIEELEDIIEAGTNVPFSGRVMIDKVEILEIIKDIRIRLPDEIKQASWIKEERQRILEEAQKDADTIMEQAEYRIEELVDQEEITRKASERADIMITNAKNNAKEIRLGSVDYADDLLLEQQEKLKELIILINENRKELREPNTNIKED